MFRPVFRVLFWVFVVNTVILGWVGANPPEGAFVAIGRIATTYYFLHFIVLLPLVGRMESPDPLPDSIATAVLQEGDGGGA